MNEQLLKERIVTFVNSTLLAADRAPVEADTPLFEQGLLDSLRVLDLIAFVEAETGRPLPDSAIRLSNFRTASAIAETALQPVSAAKRSRDRIWARTRTRTIAAPAAVADIEDELRRWGREIGAREVPSGALIPTAALERAGYLDSFPGRAVLSDADATQAVPPAACLHCYADLAGRTLQDTPMVLAVSNHCARGDEKVDGERGRLREFIMREIVVIGSAIEVDRARRGLMRKAQTYLTRLDLAASIEVATDPFHVAADRGKLALQRLRALKYELRMPVAGDTIAVASFNYHEDFFGRAFGISLADGTPAHTGCVAFGLERWELAVREQLDEARIARSA